MSSSDPASFPSQDAVPLSALNQYAYCPRRCYMIHVEEGFVDNIHTLRGTREHERVDRQTHEVQDGVRVEFALPVWSDQLGLSGRCDVVEFHPDGSIYPVEYKHGKRSKWFNDDLQLTAQALCLEEMLSYTIEKGSIFHHESRRRREVVFSQSLRDAVVDISCSVHRLLAAKRRPEPITEQQRCPQCSLVDVCQPEMVAAKKRLYQMRRRLFEPEKEI